MSASVRAIRPGEEPAVAAALADAFQRDAFAIWLLPDPDERRAVLGGMFGGLVRGAPAGAILEVTDDLDAAALWLPPGTDVTSSPPPGSSAAVVDPFAVNDAFARVNAAIPPQPYWYLHFLGARTLGAGGGSALLRQRQRETDAAGLPTALWTAAEVNLRFYAKNGYRVLERLDFDGASAWWLWRDPPERS